MATAYLPSRVKLLPALKNDFVIALGIAVGVTSLTYLLAFSVGWVSEAPNWLEIAASGLNYAATYLAIKQRRFYYIIGIVASGIYAVVYGQIGLLASAVLSLYLTIALIYGWFRWGKDKESRPVHHLQWKWVPAYILVTAAFYGGAVLVVTSLKGSFAPQDAAILVLTILAQFLLDNKVIQTWMVWTAVNVVGVITYFQAELYFAAMQQLIFGVANLWGWMAWKKTMRQDAMDRHPAGKGLDKAETL